MRIDLQFHSTYSDGKMTPTELVTWLSKNKIKVASLTDHNTVAGTEEFFLACKKKNIKAICGMELYVRYHARKFNMLFYNFDRNHPKLHQFLRQTQIQRSKNIAKALNFWKERGFVVNVEKILSCFNHYIPLNGVIKHIIESPKNMRKIKKDLKILDPHESQIIKYYFKNRENYYLSETYVDIHRLEKLQQEVGGQIIIAHPGKNRISHETILELLDKDFIDGVEILSPHHGWDEISRLMHSLKKRKNIILTGGSDFHGLDCNTFKIKQSWDYFRISSRFLHGVKKIIK